MSKRLFNKIIMFAVIIFLLILAPSQINLPKQTNTRAICTGLAIDSAEKLPDGIMLTAQIVIPQAGGQYSPNNTLVSAEGENLLDAFTQLDFNIGKKVRLAHCGFILIGYEASQNNLAETLDYLVRGNNAGNNTLLVHTSGKAKDLITIASDINSNETDNIQTIVRYNEQYVATSEANLRSFYDAYLSPHGTSIMSCLKVNNEESQGQSGGGSSGGGEQSETEQGGGSSASPAPTTDKIKNEGEIAVFKNGRLAKILTSEERIKFSWLDSRLNDNPFSLEHITDQIFDDATVGFNITDKSITAEYKFVNNTPCIYYTIDLNLRTEMISEASGKLPRTQNYHTPAIADAVQTRVSNDVADAMEIAKEYSFDTYNFYRSFLIACPIEWKKYLTQIGPDGDYMQNIEVFVKTNINTYGLGAVVTATK